MKQDLIKILVIIAVLICANKCINKREGYMNLGIEDNIRPQDSNKIQVNPYNQTKPHEL